MMAEATTKEVAPAHVLHEAKSTAVYRHWHRQKQQQRQQ